MIELLLKIGSLFYEVILVLFSWMLGVFVIKTFTLGQGRVGKLRYLEYNQKRKPYDPSCGLTAEELWEEKYYADRTFWIGMACWIIPLLSMIALLLVIVT